MANEQASRVELERRLTKQLYDIDAREDRYLDLVGHPDWPQEKLQAKLAGLREQRTLLSQQRHELANTLEIGQAVLDEALGLLAQPQALFDQADDDTRRLLTRTIFDRLSIDTRQIVDHEMREAFDALVSVQRRYQRSAAHAGTSAPRLAPCA
jgi:hypothetical protein